MNRSMVAGWGKNNLRLDGKSLLVVSATIEVATGLALLAVPSALVAMLLGSVLDTPASLAMARIAGAALLSLGISCWFASRYPKNRAASDVVVAMLLYNFAAVAILAYARLDMGLAGIGLWPAIILHAGLAVWCVVSLRQGGAP